VIVGLYTQVKTEKLQNEHNEAALPRAADIRADVAGGLRRPRADICLITMYPYRRREICSAMGEDQMKQVSRRTMLGAAATIAATPAFAEGCQVGPPPHHSRPCPDFPLTADM